MSEGETLTTALKKYAQGPTGTRNPDLKGYIKSVGAELGGKSFCSVSSKWINSHRL